MTLSGYTYQVGDLFTTSKTGITGRIAGFTPMSNKVTRVNLVLANGSRRFAMVKTSKWCKSQLNNLKMWEMSEMYLTF